MKTVGTILIAERESLGISIDEAVQQTKIRKAYLLALEADNFDALPSPRVAKGFIKNYSAFLGLPVRTVLAFYRRQIEEKSHRVEVAPKAISPMDGPRIRLTPTRFIVALIVFLLIGVSVFFASEYQKLQSPPPLVVESPDEGLIISGRRVEVKGKTDPDATVSINGVGILVREDGAFFDQIAVFPGSNTVTIVATSRYGKRASITREVVAEEPQFRVQE